MSNASVERAVFRPAARLVDGLAAYSSLILAMAEGGPIPMIGVVAGLFAIFFIDGRSDRGIPTAAAAGLGFVAFGAALAEFLNGDVEARILAGSHLMTYLAVIVLIQKKLRGDLYRLVTISALQMALAALLTNSLWLAFGLAGYIAIAFLTMSSLLWSRLSTASRAAGEIDHDSAGSTVRRLIGPSIFLTAITVIASGVAFAFVPRVWSGQLNLFNNELPPGATAETGFSESVALGEIGEVMESDDIVCEIKSFYTDTGEPARFDDEARSIGLSEPLLRGAVMDSYEDGSWTRARSPVVQSVSFDPRFMEQDEARIVRHEVTLEPLGTRILFTPGWLVAIRVEADPDTPVRIDFDRENQVFTRDDESDTTSQLDYEFYTMIGWPFGSNVRSFVNLDRSRRARELMQQLKSFSGDFGQGLRADLRAYIEAEIPELDSDETTLDKSQRVQQHLRDSGLFSYSLKLGRSETTRDPIIDFLKNQRAGHCEYFASSLALLLRAAGIPTRLVNGFKGATYDEVTGALQIRQLHAHAWVEVYDANSNQWYTFDPTPGGRDEAVQARSKAAGTKSGNRFAWLSNTWSQGMFLTRQQQQRHIYGPLGEFAKSGYSLFTGPDLEGLDGVGKRGKVSAAMGATLLFLALGGITAVIVWSRRKRKTRRATGSNNAQQAGEETAMVVTPWFDRYLDAVKTHLNQTRPQSDTQREFVDAVVDENVVPDSSQQAAPILRKLAPDITKAFYASRFGRKALSSEEMTAIEDQLNEVGPISD